MALSGNLMLSARRHTDKAKARAEIVSAIRNAKGNLTEAARQLGITKRTLSRWLAKDGALRAACRAAKK